MAAYIVAHDLGTTGDKATLFSTEGLLVGSSFSAYSTSYPKIGWAEQDAADYWSAFCNTTKSLIEKTKISPAEIACVSFSGQMMAALAVDRSGRPLRNSIIWADTRATAQTREFTRRIGADRAYEITGHRLSPSYSAAKIAWIRDNEPDVYRDTYRFIHAKDYVVFLLTDRFRTDFSDASGMNLLDINTLEWSTPMIEATGIDVDKLPEIVESVTVVGTVIPRAATECGLRSGTPVVIGGGDGACATAGAGVVCEGQAYVYLGTSTWIAFASAKPLIDPGRRTFTFCHMKKGLYFPTGTMQTGGGALQWLKDAVCDSESEAADLSGVDVYDLLSLKASRVSPGSDGLIFLPYLLGERSPLWNPEARGCFIGLSMIHGKSHMIRAVMEGVAYNMKWIHDAFLEQGVAPGPIRMIGGGARSDLWRSIFADVLSQPIVRLSYIEEAPSVGAAIAGGIGVGVFSSLEDAQRLVGKREVTDPERSRASVYGRRYDAFKRSYESLAALFPLLSDGE